MKYFIFKISHLLIKQNEQSHVIERKVRTTPKIKMHQKALVLLIIELYELILKLI